MQEEKNRPGRKQIYDPEEEAKMLLEWSLKDTSIEILEYINDRPYCSTYLSDMARENPILSEALKKTKERIALRRSKLANKNELNYGIYQRYQKMYDTTLREHEREELEIEIDIKKRISELNPPIKVEPIDYSKWKAPKE